jgi:DNA replication and repair protein RecF
VIGAFGKAMRAADAVGTFAIVFILPEDINITSGSPRYHRNFLDIYLSQFSRAYLADLMDYQRVLKQRNALLKKLKTGKAIDMRQLDVWDDALIGPAFSIMAARANFISEIRPRVADVSRLISRGHDTVDIAYHPRLGIDHEKGTDGAAMTLRQERDRDVRMGATMLGPHRDVIDITVNNGAVREFGSMGQKKTVMVAMKLAAREAISAHRGEPAILVLDEAFAVLDREREGLLLGLLSGGSESMTAGQVFLASAVPTGLDDLADVRVFRIEDGEIAS